MLLGSILLFWLLFNGLIIFHYRHVIINIWNEPVFRFPVLIIESDDWGPGDACQGQALENIIHILNRYHDSQGNSPTMTLGLTLAIADGEKIQASGFKQYYRKRLDAPEFENILGRIKEGQSNGVFYLQLHGMEHYWPPALMQSQESNMVIRDWLVSSNKTEDLPSHLQSRWSDGSQLPSKSIEEREINDYVREECDVFNSLFEHSPVVIVPPTFDWNSLVEKAWVSQGLKTLVTPGMKFKGRDENGRLIPTGDMIFNGMQSQTGLTYLVRDNYFEPVRGHKSEDVERDITIKSEFARPTLLEMHRFNYYKETAQASLSELDRMLSRVCNNFPQIRFMTTEYLAQIIKNRDSNYLRQELFTRTGYCVKRMLLVSGLRKWVKLSGFIIVFRLLETLLLSRKEKQI